MRNKKGEFSVSLMILVAVGIIVGLVLLQATASYVGTSTTTFSQSNTTRAAPANGACTDIQGYQNVIGTYIITNASNGVVVPSSNVSLVERIGTDGQLTAALCTSDARYATVNVNVSATYGPDGYINDSGGRSIASLIVLFAALAIGIFAMVPSVRDFVKENMGF